MEVLDHAKNKIFHMDDPIKSLGQHNVQMVFLWIYVRDVVQHHKLYHYLFHVRSGE